MLSPFILSDNNKAFAFLGFNLFGTGEDNQSSSTASQSSTSLQDARCYSPTSSIVDSCNSGDLSNSDNEGYKYSRSIEVIDSQMTNPVKVMIIST